METEICTPEARKLTAAAAGLTGALILAGHWAPWPRRLPRLLAYGYGGGAILAGAALLLDRAAWRRLAGITVVAGLATGLGYLVDRSLNIWMRHEATYHERHA